MGHGKSDRLHLTQAEHSGLHGSVSSNAGAQDKLNTSQYQPIPYTSCSLSLQDWELPMADPNSGTIFELTNIVPWLKKYGNQNPVDGSKLELKDLVRLNFDKDESGKWRDPVSFKLFTPHSHIVALRPTGNVFSFETVSQLNLKAKSLRDLLDDTPFTKKDIITLQDPHNMSPIKDMNQLHHLKKGMKISDSDRRAAKPDDSQEGGTSSNQNGEDDEVNIGATGSASKILKDMKKSKEAKEAKEKTEAGFSSKFPDKPRVPHNQTSISTNRAAASFTSSSLTPVTKTERVLRDEEELMLEEVSKKNVKGKGKAKAYVRLTTNFGPLNLELHVDSAPKTVYNFLTLCKEGKYNDTIFHRNIKGFMIQGGDPTGTGKGGNSMWGKKFEDEFDRPGSQKHSARGVLSMANSGPGTNGSQFFITYRPTPHLDSKHTVFGRVVNDNDTVLSNLESIPTDSNDKPLRSIKILDAQVFGDDPFDTYKEELEKKLRRENMTDEEKKIRDEKRRKREEDRTTWLGTNLSSTDDSEVQTPAVGITGSASGIGKYVNSTDSNQKRKVPSNETLSSSTSATDSFGGMGVSNKKKKGGGFGDFSSW